MLARHFAPDRLALVLAERNFAIGLWVGEENAPSVVRHLDVAERGPALRVSRDCGPQIHVAALETLGAHLAPPLQEAGLPCLERALEAAVVGETDVVGNPLRVVNRHQTLLGSNSGRVPVP